VWFQKIIANNNNFYNNAALAA